MRLNPKRLGHEFNLDEYNACQYLLYQMDCWGETVRLSMLPTEGEYATYTLRDPDELLEWNGMLSYRFIQDVTTKHYLEIEVSDKTLLPNIERVKFYYKNPKDYDIDSTTYPIHSDPTDDTSKLVTDQEVVADTSGEIPQWGVSEAKPREDLDEDFEVMTVYVTAYDDCIRVPLQVVDSEGNLTGIMGEESLIGNRFKLYFNYLYSSPQIDVANGRANTSDEILLDTVYEINRLLEFAPTDGTKIIYRLDSNMEYKLTQTNTIWDGMNVEFRGGTNENAVLDCSTCGRAFIVQDKAQLTLSHITIKNGNTTKANGNAKYYKGYGGGILVVYDENPNSEDFGILSMEDCEISNCKSDYGGAIYCFHGGLNLVNTVFKDNTSVVTGGAIYYMAQTIVLSMNNVTAQPGQKVRMICHVETVDGDPVVEGKVKFYIDGEVMDTYTMSKSLGTSTDLDGEVVQNTPGDALFYYVVPANTKTASIPVTAYYIGTAEKEVAAIQASIFIVLPVAVIATVEDVYKVFPGDTITLTCTVVDNDKYPYNSEPGHFIVDGVEQEDVEGSEEGVYTMEYKVSDGAKEDLKVTFGYSAEHITCNSNTATVQIIYGITGYFVNTGDSFNESIRDNWVNIGVTDLYVRSVANLDNIKTTRLYEVINLVKGKNIRVFATLNVFYDIFATSGHRWETPLEERFELVRDSIKLIHDSVGDSIDGFCFDYIRLNGTDEVTDQSHVETVNGYLKRLTDYVYSLNPHYLTCCCIMPEFEDAQYTYGQKPTAMLEYCDYLIPMIYRGNYGQERDWLKTSMAWYLCHVSQVRCIGDIQTYQDDGNVYETMLKDGELPKDVVALLEAIYVKCDGKTMRDNGYILFREGCIVDYPDSYRKLRGD